MCQVPHHQVTLSHPSFHMVLLRRQSLCTAHTLQVGGCVLPPSGQSIYRDNVEFFSASLLTGLLPLVSIPCIFPKSKWGSNSDTVTPNPDYFDGNKKDIYSWYLRASFLLSFPPSTNPCGLLCTRPCISFQNTELSQRETGPEGSKAWDGGIQFS